MHMTHTYKAIHVVNDRICGILVIIVTLRKSIHFHNNVCLTMVFRDDSYWLNAQYDLHLMCAVHLVHFQYNVLKNCQ